MKAYLFPAALGAAGVAMMIHASSHKSKAVGTLVPSVPVSHFRSTQTARRSLSTKTTKSTANGDGRAAHLVYRAQPMAQQSSVFDQPYGFFHDRLLTLTQCLETRQCHYPNRDPREYEIAVNADAKTTLDTLLTWQNRHHLRDDRMTDMMVDFLAFEDAGVKQRALAILATQPPDSGVLGPLLTDVVEYPQPEAIPAGMHELTRYTATADRKKIDDVLENVLRRGAVNSAVAVAQNLKPLLNSGNWNRYDKIRDDLARSPLSEDIYSAMTDVLDGN